MNGPAGRGEAAAVNARLYDMLDDAAYVEAAPHVKHEPLRRLYAQLVQRVHGVVGGGAPPRVLDLGAGGGLATLPFLELGARVTAVDVSAHQLALLAARAGSFGARLDARLGDAQELVDAAARAGEAYDVVVANSFLHHVPDYLALVRRTLDVLAAGGVLFTFQDPLRYASLPAATRAIAGVAYASWRVRQADVVGGAARRLRRTLRGHREDVAADAAEYHALRGGVDQDALRELLAGRGLDVEVVRYFSTQSPAWQRLGERLRLQNMFAIIARRNR